MNVPILSEDDIRRIFREELQHFCSRTSPANAHAEEDELIGSNEACRILGCSTRTLQRYRDQRLFSVRMLGPKKAQYFRSEIEAFRAANTRPSRNTK